MRLDELHTPEAASAALAADGYVADRALGVAVALAGVLGQPLLLEGEAGVGKTDVARALAHATGARLIRLQCHEGIDLHHAVYDWDYPRQLLALRAAEGGLDEGELYSRRFLLARPLLQALEDDGEVVLLIDEIDRADDEFEAFLLEFLSDYAVTIPELGTVTAARAPVVILTSNRTRELHDALKRRCLYHWIDYPSPEREQEIVRARVPDAPAAIVARVVDAVTRLRDQGDLYKLPGVGETLVWARALLALGPDADLEETLGVALKVHEDVIRVRERGVLEVSEVVSRRLAELAGTMRLSGARVGVGELLAAHRALAALPLPGREDARLALRAVMCSRREDFARFDAAFAAVFDAGLAADAPATALDELGTIERAALPRAAFGDPSAADDPPRLREPRLPTPAAWSEVELLGPKDFAEYTDAEVVLARDLIGQLARRAPMRASRRLRVAHRRSHTLDLRRTVRASLAHGGEPVDRRWRAPTERPRPVVLVCDVSGSMAPYARMLLQYMHACVAARRSVEAFAFATRLTRITHELAGRDHDRALQRACEAVVDLSGGTRIGAALSELNRSHGRRIGRGACVIVLSDGWDRGEPELLAAEMARLRLSAHRLVWLNPLAADPRYEPLTRGMQAAIPYTDRMLAGNSLDSLRQLALTLEEL